MNIKITYNWLLDYLDTDADPYEIQKYLSLCGPSVESVEKIGNEYVFDIEITSNRIDTASVFGIAQEAQTILPQFDKKAKIKFNPIEKLVFKNIKEKDENKLNIEIQDANLISRLSVLVLSKVKIKESPKLIKQRLMACGVKTINNVVDVSNYIRIALGQPCHIFDYDSIGDSKMIVRKSKKGEALTTLDKDKVILPGDDIIISDGKEKIIDQPGIMGAFNSSVKPNTKNILLFVPVFNGKMVRRTAMLTGKRSDSASYFEKGLDEERTETTLVFGAGLLEKSAKAKISSKIIDIYEEKYKPKSISVSFSNINKLIGQDIDKKNVLKILNRLGFAVIQKKDILNIAVPSFRKNDISIKEDVVEEVARISGYYNIPSKLQNMAYVPTQKDLPKINNLILDIKKYLKHIGLTEIINYSMISKEQIKNCKLNEKDHLKVSNPISFELEYLRTTLIPSLLSNLKINQGKQEKMMFFEVSKIFLKQKEDLPKEILKLSIITNTNYFDLKGIVEALLIELNIKNAKFVDGNSDLLVKLKQTQIMINNKNIGILGMIKNDIGQSFGLIKQAYVTEINLLDIVQNSKKLPEYRKTASYAMIKLDLTVKNISYEDFKTKAFANSTLLIDIKVLDKYQDNITFRLFFSSYEKNLTEKEALIELNKIKKAL
ncbi:MAG: phenylalanine--tRNA ligase subunit beta [bacterium]